MTEKASGAFRTIGELSKSLGVPQHVLRYWETRFSQLRPMTRAGNRRYYRVEDVALVERIHRLLNQEGYTVKGVQKLLANKPDNLASPPAPDSRDQAQTQSIDPALIAILTAARDRLAAALAR